MNILYPQIIATIIIIKPSNNPIQKIILNLKKKFREMNFAKFPFRIVKYANNNFSTGRFKGRFEFSRCTISPNYREGNSGATTPAAMVSAHRGEKIKCPLSETRDTVEIARDSGARTSCAGCDDEAVYTMGWYNEGW